jgi:lipopolysaccharide export system ATP-binding protein
MTSTLTASHLAKSYKKRTVVRDVSLSVSTSEIVGLLGPNGAGKTTCFYMIAGIIPLDKGDIYIDDTKLTDQPIHKRAQLGLGYLPQEASIFRSLSTEKNILAILELRKELSRNERHDKLELLLEEFNLQHVRHTHGMALSGGERRRVEIARCLATEPSFILLDEPFAGVDPISVNDIKHIIYKLQKKGIGVLITDHNVRETLDICEKAYIVSEGEIIAQGDTKTITENEQVKAVYLGESFKL